MSLTRRIGSRGVTMIMVAGVLTILAASGAGFYSVIIMGNKAALRYSDSVRASMLAQAGINDAIARMREQTFYDTEAVTDPWCTVDWRHGANRKISFPSQIILNGKKVPTAYSRSIGNSAGTNSDVYTLNISDAASKININAGDNLAVLLDNLCRVIGPPLTPADLDAIQPRRWAAEGSPAGMYITGRNGDDSANTLDMCFRLDKNNRPIAGSDGSALYGDGYAIAGYRSRHGLYKEVADVRFALTATARPDHPELEVLEREVKYNAIRDYITINSWVDTNTVCVGKFEWSQDGRVVIDRDKSWVADDPKNDPKNRRGSLRGSYVSIVNGHGSGQLRRIATNGMDWIQVEDDFVVPPGPISSYMIIAKEDALIDPSTGDPLTDNNGNLKDDPDIDYKHYPLCIHRAPININTAPDKVLAAMFLNINVQHGTPLAVGTDSDTVLTAQTWSTDDPLKLFGKIPTLAGLKRAPVCSGKPTLDRPVPWLAADSALYNYINNIDTLGTPYFLRQVGGVCNEAHELAYRIISARQRTIDTKIGVPTKSNDPDPVTADPETGFAGYERGTFKSWDDFYFRVVKPWDDIRSYGPLPDASLPGRMSIPNSGGMTKGLGKASLAPMIMAHFNSNTDILKFNPNIEWIDRWGRNFTAMEPVMAFNGGGKPIMASGLMTGPTPPGGTSGSFYYIRNMRYRVEEMIDKTDLNRSTTEFSMDSGGTFEIKSTGMVVKDGLVRSERKVEALVQLYDVWRESTQRQFVQGTISTAQNQGASWTSADRGDCSGTMVRDVLNDASKRLALNTMPEPLVPLTYRLKNNFGGRIEECVDDIPRDARGGAKDSSIPDVIANKILPAIYDGQICLATNVCSFNPADGDTFLASYNGDLDTDTCVGNGREQAKTPENSRIRVCDTIGLLGLLNDKEIDLDPFSYPVFALNVSSNGGVGVGSPLAPLANDNYANCVSCRMGDLRTDGVYCGILGTSCKDGTLKYAYGNGAISGPKTFPGPAAKLTYQNYDPRNSTIGMWFKPLWHANDHLEHEFFNGTSNGPQAASRGNKLGKNGYVQGGGGIGWPVPDGTLWTVTEDFSDGDVTVCLHSGTDNVNAGNLPPSQKTETPSFHTQPFRWSYIGMVENYNSTALLQYPEIKLYWPYAYSFPTYFVYPLDPFVYSFYWLIPQIGGYPMHWNYPPIVWDDEYGFYHNQNPSRVVQGGKIDVVAGCVDMLRPYISTCRYPDSAKYTTPNTDNMWVLYNFAPILKDCDLDGQPAAYPWQKSKNGKSKEGCFSINNTNQGPGAGGFLHIYRQQPTDSAYSVIDEFKITKKSLTPKQIGDVMTTSRYYLPPNPRDISQQPTFTSQTMLRSLNGFAATGGEDVTLVRLNWNVFTPRFMHEYKKVGTYSHKEVVSGKVLSVPIAGPFDYAQYNADIDYDHDVGWKSEQLNPHSIPLGVNRPSPKPGVQSHYTKGVEIEILKGDTPQTGFENSTGTFVATQTFVDPDVVNTFMDPKHPTKTVMVSTDKLRYRVRFKYPVYMDADTKATMDTVNPTTQFLLDTPVFDDISITYVSPVRIRSYREVLE